MDKSTAGDDEDFEDTDRELQDLVRLEVQWASSFFLLAGQIKLPSGFCLNSLDVSFVESV